MLTQEELKKYLHYNPDTGIFTWVNRCKYGGVKAGDIAGYQDKFGYCRIKLNNKNYRSHRLAWLYMTGLFPVDMIDHINSIKNDNRFINLREASNQENHFNVPKRRDNTSGYKGVSWHKGSNRWQANATIDKKYKHLGRFDIPELASQAYQEFCAKHHGEFYINEALAKDKQ